jgi:hypothetical protein
MAGLYSIVRSAIAGVTGANASEVIAASYDSALIRAENERRSAMAARREMLHDNFLSEILAAINDTFADAAVAAIMRKHATVELNLFANVINTISVVYAWGAHRQIGDGDSENNRLYQILLRECRLDSRLALANTLLNACNEVLLRPVVRVYGGQQRMCLDVLTPDCVTAIPREDDPTRPAVLLVYRRFPHASPPRAYVDVWTDDTLAQYEGNYDRVALAWDTAPGDDRQSKITVSAGTSWQQWLDLKPRTDLGTSWQQPNPYKRIPYLIAHKREPVDSLWDTTAGNDLVDATISVGLLMTFLRRLGKDQVEKLIYHSGRAEDLPPAQRLDMTSILALPQGGGVLDWSHNPEVLLAQIRARASFVASRYGIPEALLFLSGTGLTYGDAASMRIPLWEVRARQIREVWDPVERDLFDLMSLVSRTDHQTLKIEDEEDGEPVKLRVRFSDAPAIASPLDLEKLYDSRVAAGTLSKLERLMAQRPYIDTIEEAEEVQASIADHNRIHNEYMRETNAPGDGSLGQSPQMNGAMGPLLRDGKVALMSPPKQAPPEDEEADDGREG